jgi:hypothetical protein
MNRYLIEVLFSLGLFAAIAIVTVIAELVDKKREKNMSDDCFVVRQPLIFFFRALAITIAFVAFLLLMRLSQRLGNETVHESMYIFCSIGAVFGVYLIIDYLRWRVRVEGIEIYYRSLLSSKKFALSEIKETKIDKHQNLIVFNVENVKILSVPKQSRGYDKLQSYLKQKETPPTPVDKITE